MRNFLSLLRLQLNAQIGFSYARYQLKNDKKALWKGIGLGLAILAALVEVLGLYILFMVNLCEAAASMHAPQMILTLAAIVSGLIVLVFGIFYILGSLFLARDTEFLASLPIPQGSVFLSKFVLVLIREYPLAFGLMLPPVIIYGIGAQKGVLYYLLAILCTLFLPLLPLVLSAAASLLLMNIVSRSRRRDLITTVGSVLLLVLFIGGQNYFMSRVPENGQDFMMSLLQSSNALIDFIGRAFPPSVWVTKILSSSGMESFINLLYLVLISLGSFAVVYLIASFIYQRGATAQLETQSKPGKTRLAYGSSNAVMAIFKNEWRILLRTPVYALNGLVVIIMVPLIMIMPLFGGNFAKDPDLQFLYNLIQSGETNADLLLIIAGIISLLSIINPAISTTISREGRNIWILKNIPVAPETLVMGKFLAGYSISLIATVLAAAIAMFSFKTGPILTLMILALSALALIPACAFSLYLDLVKPKLVWNNPQEAMKQNMNSLFAMLLSFLILSVFGVIAYFLNRLDLSVYILFGIMVLILAAASIASVSVLKKQAPRSFGKWEV